MLAPAAVLLVEEEASVDDVLACGRVFDLLDCCCCWWCDSEEVALEPSAAAACAPDDDWYCEDKEAACELESLLADADDADGPDEPVILRTLFFIVVVVGSDCSIN